MVSILFTVFLLQLTIHLVNTVGASTVTSILWNIYNRLPIANSESAADRRDKQKAFMKIRKELNATSSQDEFAKWAKLRRQHDKALEELEKSKASSDTTRKTFDSVVSALRWLGTTGAVTLLQFWYSKQPIFWLPQNWMPTYAEWLLCFPRAPIGSISIHVWTLACKTVIKLVSDAIVAVVALVLQYRTTSHKSKQPVKVSAAAGAESKKEL